MKFLKETINWREIKKQGNFTKVQEFIDRVEINTEACFKHYSYKENFVRADFFLDEIMVVENNQKTGEIMCRRIDPDSKKLPLNKFEEEFIKPQIEKIKDISKEYGFKVKFEPFEYYDHLIPFIKYYIQIRIPYSFINIEK